MGEALYDLRSLSHLVFSGGKGNPGASWSE
jgi:hypothetical protein